jgi:hypothetical protein
LEQRVPFLPLQSWQESWLPSTSLQVEYSRKENTCTVHVASTSTCAVCFTHPNALFFVDAPVTWFHCVTHCLWIRYMLTFDWKETLPLWNVNVASRTRQEWKWRYRVLCVCGCSHAKCPELTQLDSLPHIAGTHWGINSSTSDLRHGKGSESSSDDSRNNSPFQNWREAKQCRTRNVFIKRLLRHLCKTSSRHATRGVQ